MGGLIFLFWGDLNITLLFPLWSGLRWNMLIIIHYKTIVRLRWSWFVVIALITYISTYTDYLNGVNGVSKIFLFLLHLLCLFIKLKKKVSTLLYFYFVDLNFVEIKSHTPGYVNYMFILFVFTTRITCTFFKHVIILIIFLINGINKYRSMWDQTSRSI